MKDIFNRELSWLQFNDRVLQEAQDKSVPLIQRLRFLGIYSNNQDEFVKVRVANLIRYAEKKRKLDFKMTGGITPEELLPKVNFRIEKSQELFKKTFNEIESELKAENIHFVTEKDLTTEQLEFCQEYFLSVISMRLVPLIVRKSSKFPEVPDGKIYLAIKMRSARSSRYAILQIPVSAVCPRFVRLPSENGRNDIIFLDDIIRLFLDNIFFMFTYDDISAHTFKVVRDAEFVLDDDVLKSVSEKFVLGVSNREKGKPVRLIYDKDMPLDLLNTISKKLGFKNISQIEAGGRYHLLRDFMKFPKIRKDLESNAPKPLIHPYIDPFNSILKVIRKQDILLCYPYHTFTHFIDMLREAAIDPRVQSISITLYRAAEHSKVINALINAAKNGKNVTALVELKARFDEEQNLYNSEVLQNAGVKVIHSSDGVKVHSKLVLIERLEGQGEVKGYTYIGTGNFNESTTNIYSDFGLFTMNQEISNDARHLFDYLTHTHKQYKYKKLIVSPFFMREEIEEIIENEIKNAKKGKKAYFYGKFNSLTDEKFIRLLYKASKAGVTIRLIVRGACCLVAGQPEISENIEVRSIIDKYLEHARLIIACNNGKPLSYIMSADLMTRNLDRRVEVGVPIINKNIHKTLVKYFDLQWSDNVKARRIAPPYLNNYVTETTKEENFRCQDEIYHFFASMYDE